MAAVGDLEDLLQFVGDEDDGFALLHQRRDGQEELLGLLRGQHRRRLIQDQNVGLAIQRLDDFHALASAHRQVSHRGLGVNLQAVLARESTDTLNCGLAVQDEAVAHDFGAQHDVLRHGHHRNQHEMLVYHADTLGDGVAGSFDLHLFSIQEDLPFVRRIQAVQDVHQGALASPVLAQQGMDLPFLQLEINVVVGEDAGEPFGDIT
jgi:hypothetical protein